MKKHVSVSIGIPAYNESDNIQHTIMSVLKQRIHDHLLDKIMIVCDGCTDDTVAIVQEIVKDHPIVECIVETERKGKATRLNQIYSRNTSAVIVTLDADIVLEGPHELEKMVDILESDDDIAVVAAHEQAVYGNSVQEKIIAANQALWDEIRLQIPQQDHVHNLWGSASAIRKSFADSFQYPQDKAVSDSHYLYFMVKKEQKKFRYALDTNIWYRIPSNVKDYALLSTRAIHNKVTTIANHGEWVTKYYEVPRKYKWVATIRRLYKDPIFTTAALILNVYTRVFPMKNSLKKDGTWEMVSSTKKAIVNE